MGPGGDQLLTPSLQLFLLLQQYIYTSFNPLCVDYVRIVLTRICCHSWDVKKKGKVPVQYAWVGRTGSLPPPPAPLAEPWGGGKVGEPCPAWGFWAGKGGSLASEFGGLFSRVDLADFHGKTFWRVILAHLLGGFSQVMKSKLLSKEREVKEMYNQWICRLHNVIIY